ncbi:MAG: hypothetical protein J0I20_06615 [Chloroflexi bacterium]|nr:hypothetical protein [Chloroflexota bacterium]OJV95105.1 MAG: hypothetical protein BGO39_24110 [Chloroflexi bacterium 54-19]
MSSFSISNPAFQPGDNLSLTNTFQWPDKTFRHEYRFSQGEIATGLEPWLALALLPAMVARMDIRLEEPVSARFMAGIEKVQDVFCSWDPDKYHRVNIEGATCLPPARPTAGRATAGFFSGGVDSFYTLFRHYAEIDTLVYMKNPFISEADESIVSGRIRKIARLVDKNVIEVLPLVREYTEPHLIWYYAHGAVMASCALMLEPQLAKVYFASTHSYRGMAPNGTHPLLDRLWSTETIEFATDGSEATRIQKLEYISQFEVALRHLQVCVWDLPDTEKVNCGECYKCLMTQAALRVLGKLDQCPVFAKPLDLDALARHQFDSFYNRTNLLELLTILEKRGDDPALANALAAALANQEPLPTLNLLGIESRIAALHYQADDLRRELAVYQTALRYQLADRVYNLLSRNKAVHRAGELLAHRVARFFK